jgi:hypothetical protein
MAQCKDSFGILDNGILFSALISFHEYQLCSNRNYSLAPGRASVPDNDKTLSFHKFLPWFLDTVNLRIFIFCRDEYVKKNKYIYVCTWGGGGVRWISSTLSLDCTLTTGSCSVGEGACTWTLGRGIGDGWVETGGVGGVEEGIERWGEEFCLIRYVWCGTGNKLGVGSEHCRSITLWWYSPSVSTCNISLSFFIRCCRINRRPLLEPIDGVGTGSITVNQ